MSRVCLIAADKPLPLCDKQSVRTSTCVAEGETFTVSALQGFCVEPHSYYRHAVDLLNYPIKPHQYELHMELCEEDLAHLRQYLTEHFSAGETAELWCIWVGDDQSGHLPHCRGTLADFDMETLAQFLQPSDPSHAPGQCCLTIII